MSVSKEVQILDIPSLQQLLLVSATHPGELAPPAATKASPALRVLFFL
jgi:hypothetical protein